MYTPFVLGAPLNKCSVSNGDKLADYKRAVVDYFGEFTKQSNEEYRDYNKCYWLYYILDGNKNDSRNETLAVLQYTIDELKNKEKKTKN